MSYVTIGCKIFSYSSVALYTSMAVYVTRLPIRFMQAPYFCHTCSAPQAAISLLLLDGVAAKEMA